MVYSLFLIFLVLGTGQAGYIQLSFVTFFVEKK